MPSSRAFASWSGSRRATVTALALLAALGPSTVDLYLPALPAIRAGLDATASTAQATLTATTIGLAVGQLIVGSWSDAAGRLRPLTMTLALHILGSIGVAVAPDIGWVLGFRFAQGVGAAGAAVISTAIVRDLFSGSTFAAVLAKLALVSGLAPVVAPVVGSQLLTWFDWRGLFVTVAAFGILCLLTSATLLPESLPASRRLGLRPAEVAHRYAALLSSRTFVAVAVLGGLMVSGVYALMTGSSLLLQGAYGLSPNQYSAAFAVNAISFVVGTQSAARLVRRVEVTRILWLAIPLQFAAAVAVIVALPLGAAVVTGATAAFMLGAGLCVPCLQILGMAGQAHQAGTAAALLGAANFGIGGITAPLVGSFGPNLGVSMGCVMAGTQLLAILVLTLALGRAGRCAPPPGFPRL